MRHSRYIVNVACVAYPLGLLGNVICELFKKEFSLSPVRYVTKVRIDRAKELLVSGRHTVTEISELCGFENVYYFSSVFKKAVGVSPSEYTKRL